MQIDNPSATNDRNDLENADKYVSPPTNSLSEPMPIDNTPNNKIDDENESSATEDSIHYDPNEVMDETSVEQQPAPIQSERALMRKHLKKFSLRLVDFKTFYDSTLSTQDMYSHDKFPATRQDLWSFSGVKFRVYQLAETETSSITVTVTAFQKFCIRRTSPISFELMDSRHMMDVPSFRLYIHSRYTV
ncbi:unnamed protein product [Larinioides sclopetarius]|uniref:Uncharacterized protein n=1 Tax=Larinioides sclopetarius TaxID=280406 RepID=A0AAV1YYL4_9ARAC